MQHIDRIIRSKNVFTAQDGIDTARELAIAIAGDRIVAVGAPDDVIAAAPAATPVIDYGEQFVCPGFHDAHLHFFHTSVGSSPYMLMDMGTSEAALVQHALEFSQDLPSDAWVVTQGWRDYRWDPPEHPTKASLDVAFPNRPCVMYSGDGHTLWLNSRALEALGVTRDSEPPAGGSYDKDANGELTGIAHEAAAMQLLPRCLEWLGEDRIASAYADQMRRMAEQGITSICDMSLMPMPGCDFIRDDVYDKLQAAGKLGIRAHLFPTLLDDQSRLEELQTRYANNALLSAPGFKQFFDGVSSEHTAYLTEPYTNPRFPGDQGRLTVPAERMRRLVLAAAERGHTVRIHVIGDGAISSRRPPTCTACPSTAITRSSTWRTSCPRTSIVYASLTWLPRASPVTLHSTRAAPSAIWAWNAAASCGRLRPISSAASAKPSAPIAPSQLLQA